MGIFDRIFQRQDHAGPTSPRSTGEPRFSYSQYSNYWHEPEIAHRVIMDYYKREGRFREAVDTKRDFSVGNGFYLTSKDGGKGKGKKILEFLQDFVQRVNLDQLNSNIARDMWAAGNCFIKIDLEHKPDEYTLRIVPLDSITDMILDDRDEPTHYVQQLVQRVEIPADSLAHFKMNAIGSDIFGEGMGQIAVRVGKGYTTINNKKLKRPSYFAIQEMITDSMSKVFWAGLPRWFISAKGVNKEQKTQLDNAIKNMNPLQHLISSDDVAVNQMSLDTQNRHGDFIRHMENMMTIAFQDPIAKLWADQNFTYASSKEAIDVLLPSIDSYKRQHKRFIELKIFRTIVDHEFGPGSFDEFPVDLNWGREMEPSIEDLKPLAEILTMVPALTDTIDMRSLAEYIQALGVDIKINEKQTSNVSLSSSSNNEFVQHFKPKEDKDKPKGESSDKIAEALKDVADKL